MFYAVSKKNAPPYCDDNFVKSTRVVSNVIDSFVANLTDFPAVKEF